MSKQTDLINIPDAITVSGSNVGIGTSSPSDRLVVQQDASGVQPILALKNDNTTDDNGVSLDFAGKDTGGNNITYGRIASKYTNHSTEKSHMIFSHRNNSGSFSEWMRVTHDGNIIVPDGITLGTSAGVSSAANTLEDYEEGTWTASFSGTTATNITNTTGYYTKIGNTVHFSYYSSEVDFANSVTGGAKITGLPFNASNSTQRYGLFLTSYGNGIGGESNGGFVSKNDNFLVFMVQESNSEATFNNGANRRIMVAGTYMVD